MKAKRVICVIKGHEWIVGRVAGREHRDLVVKKSYHNRACTRCGKEEWNADDTEAEAEEIRLMKERLGFSKARAEMEAMDPRDRPIDPNGFP